MHISDDTKDINGNSDKAWMNPARFNPLPHLNVSRHLGGYKITNGGTGETKKLARRDSTRFCSEVVFEP